ncbi:CRGN protein, partial [Polyodon spathula]|nr:CRGN protein [Polyodon spathula]
IVFYEGKCFTGRKLEVYGDSDNFQDRGFMNRVNSIRVESGAWICFDHPDFRGQQYILEHGEYPEFHRWNAHKVNYKVRILFYFKVIKYSATVLRGSFAGNGGNVTYILLSAEGSELRVKGNKGWVMYEEPNYRGRMYIVERGNYRSHTDWQGHSANIQSIRRVANYF